MDYRDSGYVFTTTNGDPLAPVRLTRLFQGLVAEHGLPPIRLHDLRHGAATPALAAGVELKVVQDMLGHSSIVLTADTYTSVLPEVAHRAAEKTAKHVMKAGRLIPGTNRVRRRDPGRRKRRSGARSRRRSRTRRPSGRKSRCGAGAPVPAALGGDSSVSATANR
ncbi:hypothetical protein GCM10010182_82140 [Actinomadura cremea]|nr:hypothetical protein GCM10010182_82140 [Actinomadura cremea]